MRAVAIAIIRKPMHFFHKWIVDEEVSNGFTIYSECPKCLSRKVEQPSGAYQPIDWDWVNKPYDKETK